MSFIICVDPVDEKADAQHQTFFRNRPLFIYSLEIFYELFLPPVCLGI